MILQLNWALDMNRMLVTQLVVDWAMHADKNSTALPSPMLSESSIAGLTLNENAINSQHLSLILDKVKDYKMIDRANEMKLIEKISGDPIKINCAIRGLLCAIKTIEAGQNAMNELCVEVGKVIMKFVTGAHNRQKQTKSSSRVIGSLLMEALEWDKNVKIPKHGARLYASI